MDSVAAIVSMRALFSHSSTLFSNSKALSIAAKATNDGFSVINESSKTDNSTKKDVLFANTESIDLGKSKKIC